MIVNRKRRNGNEKRKVCHRDETTSVGEVVAEVNGEKEAVAEATDIELHLDHFTRAKVYWQDSGRLLLRTIVSPASRAADGVVSIDFHARRH